MGQTLFKDLKMQQSKNWLASLLHDANILCEVSVQAVAVDCLFPTVQGWLFLPQGTPLCLKPCQSHTFHTRVPPLPKLRKLHVKVAPLTH